MTMQDPTRNEMLTFLCGLSPGETDSFDWEEAIYWFAANYHGGQSTNLYEALSASPYSPGPLRNEPSEGMPTELYQELVSEYGC
jgi:hypothetical protein